MKKRKNNSFVKYSKLLFLGMTLLLLTSCEKEQVLLEHHSKQEGKVERVSLSSFKSKVLKNDQYENLVKYFFKNTSHDRMYSDLNSDSNITILTNDIIHIQKDGVSYYTFKVITDTSGNEFYNLIVHVNSQGEIIKSEFLKYTPSYSWLTDTSQPFTGYVKLIENDFLSVENLFNRDDIEACIIDYSGYWTCSEGFVGHAPSDNCGAESFNWVITIEWGPCHLTIDDGDSSSSGGDTFNNDGFPIDNDPIGIGGGDNPNGSPTVPENPCEFNDNGTGLTGNNGGCFDMEFNAFVESLNSTQSTWINNPTNSKATNLMNIILQSNDYSEESKNFVKKVIDELINNPDVSDAEAEIMLDLFNEKDWIEKLKAALATGITTTAELVHAIYNEISDITTTYPMLEDSMNIGVKGLKEVVSLVTDTNPQTADWVDLFNMWLFEIGPNSINFQINDATTMSLKVQEGVNQARTLAMERVAQGNFNSFNHSWQYGQQEFYDGLVGGNIATAFLGSYTTTVTTIQNANGTVTYTFSVNNTSGWASATRLRIDNDGDGVHDPIILNKTRGEGILLGGNFNQTWTWSETH